MHHLYTINSPKQVLMTDPFPVLGLAHLQKNVLYIKDILFLFRFLKLFKYGTIYVSNITTKVKSIGIK